MGHKELDTTEWLTHISQNHSKKPFRETQESENWFFTHTETRLCGFHPSIIWREDYVPSWLNVLDFPLSVLLESVYCFIACVLSCFSPIWLFVTLWTVAHQALLSMEFSSQEYWSGLPFPSPGGLLDPGIKPMSLVAYICRRVLDHLASPEGKELSAQTVGKTGTCWLWPDSSGTFTRFGVCTGSVKPC